MASQGFDFELVRGAQQKQQQGHARADEETDGEGGVVEDPHMAKQGINTVGGGGGIDAEISLLFSLIQLVSILSHDTHFLTFADTRRYLILHIHLFLLM